MANDLNIDFENALFVELGFGVNDGEKGYWIHVDTPTYDN